MPNLINFSLEAANYLLTIVIIINIFPSPIGFRLMLSIFRVSSLVDVTSKCKYYNANNKRNNGFINIK